MQDQTEAAKFIAAYIYYPGFKGEPILTRTLRAELERYNEEMKERGYLNWNIN